MTFVSYAQNFEDVMLWRALKHVECGFYIDVGANDPEIDSVTKAFYDRGWRGINIEPVVQWHKRLEEKRPRDINLQIAVGAHQGELVIYELPDTGLSTQDKAIAMRHEAERGYTKFEHLVSVETLTSVCKRFHLTPIHFLKIDVEGAEKDVLVGLDLSQIRPWIIVIESTLPNTQIQNHMQWESILYAANYEYVYFDGLNRYYLTSEHDDLKPHFNAPPNVFDEFILNQQFISELKTEQAEAKAEQAEAEQAEAKAKAEQAEAEQAEAKAKAEQAEAEQAEAKAKAEQAEVASNQYLAQLHAVYASTSWRITAPLRAMWWTLMWPRRYTAKLQMPLGIVRSGIQRSVASVVNSGIRCAQKSPRFRRLAFYFLHHMPAVLMKLRQIRIESQLSHGTYYFDSAAGWALTPELPSTGLLGHTAADLPQAPVVNGMNSQQRSPLEAYIHVYIGR